MSQTIDDIANYLQNNAIGTLGTNLFESLLPDDNDNAVAVIETGGTKPSEYIPNKRPSFQILVRSTAYDVGRTTCDNIRALLHNKYNIQFIVNGIYFYFCRLITEGGHLGQDKNGRDLFSMNFECYTR